MLIYPNATKTYVDSNVKTTFLNYTKYFLNVETPAKMQVVVKIIQKNVT